MCQAWAEKRGKRQGVTRGAARGELLVSYRSTKQETVLSDFVKIILCTNKVFLSECYGPISAMGPYQLFSLRKRIIEPVL